MFGTRTHLLSAIAVSAVATLAGTASATTINSFNTGAVFSGITMSPAFGAANTSYTITLNAGAILTIGGNSYGITDITGFWALAYSFNDGAQTSLAAPTGFHYDNKHQTAGSIYGWDSDTGNSGITVGNHATFNFNGPLNAHYTTFGFHLRLSDGTTANYTGVLAGLSPTPGAAALLGFGMLASTRRRRV
jgi:MYXO-CTERM domain-containing protein